MTYYIHLVDHPGTIYEIVNQLSIYKNHKIITSFSHKNPYVILKKEINKNPKLIIHTTGSERFFFKIRKKIINLHNDISFFIHVSPQHFMIKGRLEKLYEISKLQAKFGVKVLTPSNNIKDEFLSFDIISEKIQFGINFKPISINTDEKKYITTVCTSNSPTYMYIKGIDIFSKIIKELNLKNNSKILGCEGNFTGIECKKVKKSTFLKILSKSIAYVQLSRTESYNISAIYAKRLKIPVVVSNIEGHIDNVRFGIRVDNENKAKKTLKRIIENNKKIKRIVELNYKDSIKRETTDKFRDSLEIALGR